MSDHIHLVTEDTDRAFWMALRCTPYDAPDWVSAVSDPVAIFGLPDGVKCHGLWFSPRKFRSDAEQAWIARRLMGGILPLDDADQDRIFAYQSRGDRASEIIADVVPEAHRQAARHPKSEISDLVQSQRWI